MSSLRKSIKKSYRTITGKPEYSKYSHFDGKDAYEIIQIDTKEIADVIKDKGEHDINDVMKGNGEFADGRMKAIYFLETLKSQLKNHKQSNDHKQISDELRAVYVLSNKHIFPGKQKEEQRDTNLDKIILNKLMTLKNKKYREQSKISDKYNL